MMRRILFTGGGGAAAESIFEQWHGRYDLYFGDADPSTISPRIPLERRVRLPFARDTGFVDRVFDVARQLSLDLVVPGVDEELTPLAMRANHSPAPILLPDASFVETMLDKLQTASSISAAGLTAPRTLPFERAQELTFPIIVKPRSGRGSRGVRQVTDPSQLSAYLALSDVADPAAFVAQDCVVGQEYTVFVAADRERRLAAVVPVKALIKRGITIRAETDAAPEILDYARRFQAHFQPAGVYNIQLILTADRKVFPFEVNPRISTTFCLAIATGFDPIAAFLDGQSGPVFYPERHWSLQRTWRNSIEPLQRAGQSQG
jgi:carbamoyl-phosphate synthase large subunit